MDLQHVIMNALHLKFLESSSRKRRWMKKRKVVSRQPFLKPHHFVT